MNKKSKSKIIVDPRGQWAHPGKPTRIPSNHITMQNVPFPVMAYPDFGMPQMMYPEKEYYFPKAKYVDEYPQMQSGGAWAAAVKAAADAKKAAAAKANSTPTVWNDFMNTNLPVNKADREKLLRHQKMVSEVWNKPVKQKTGDELAEAMLTSGTKENLEAKAKGLIGQPLYSELGVQRSAGEAVADATLGDSNFNPYNTSSERGVSGYLSDIMANAPEVSGNSLDEAFLNAKKQGLSEFKYKGQRYNTQLKMSLLDESKVEAYRPSGAKDMSYVPVVVNYYGMGSSLVPGGAGHIEAFSLTDPNYQINANDAEYQAFGKSGNFKNIDIGDEKTVDPSESLMIYLTPDEYKNFQREVGNKKGTKWSELSKEERANNPDYYNVLTKNCSDATCRAMGVKDPGNIIAKQFTMGQADEFGTLPNAAFEAIRSQYKDRIVPATGRALNLGTYVPEKQSSYHTSPLPGREWLRGMGFAKGGEAPKVRIPKEKKGIKSKAYSRSLEATNRLFALNPLFDKPKSRKRKIFDPNASFYAEGGVVSFDFDDTLDTDLGLQMAKNTPSTDKYIISARPKVTPDMLARAREAGIPDDRIFAMGSDEAKVAKVRELGIDRHIDNKQSVVDKLGFTGQLFQEGGSPYTTQLSPEDEERFQQFYQTLPENLQQDDPSYDIRGYWDSEGRPEGFDYNQPTEDDGYYHAYSINSNTGEYLKSPWHPTFQHAVDEDRKIGYRPVVNVRGEVIAVENPALQDEFIEAELSDEEIQAYRDGGYIVEEIGRFQGGGVTTVPTQDQVAPQQVTPMMVPEMVPTGDLVAPPIITEPVVATPAQQPTTVVSTPVQQPKTPTKKEVEKVAMPKIEQTGDVKAIQKKLVAAGYDIGKSGVNRDGVDGIMGNRTQMALDAFNAGIPPAKAKTVVPKKETQKKNVVVNKNLGTGYLPYLDKGEEVCVKGKGCSSNVSIKMSNLLGGIADGDIWANDAWFNKSDVLNKGGDLIYETTERDFSKMPKVPKDVYSKLQVGDYVQLNRPDTKSSGEFAAQRKGNLQNEQIEHLGFIVGKDKDGTPLVWHGSEKGKAFIQRIDEPITLNDHDKSTFTYQVASIVRSPSLKNVDMSGLQNTAYYSTIDPKQKLVPSKSATERQRQAAAIINGNIKNIKNLGYTQEDANFVGQILVGGIMQNETQGGESNKRIPKQIAATIWKDYLGQGEFEGDEPSIGYYQMKPTLNFINKDGSLNSLGKRLEKLGVDPKDIGTFDIDAQTKAGTIILLDNYEKLKKDPKFNVKTGLYNNKIPASYILAKSWQAGTDWQNKDKYKKFLANLDVDYSNNALKNAVNTISITGSKRTVNSDYAKVKAHHDKIQAQKDAAAKKAQLARIKQQQQMYANISKAKAESRKIGYAESTAVRNLPTRPIPDLRKIDLTKKPATKYKNSWEAAIDLYKKELAKASAKKPAAKKPAAKPVAKKPVVQPVSFAQTLKNINNPFYTKFAKGGIVTELSPKEIEAYKRAGYIIEELD